MNHIRRTLLRLLASTAALLGACFALVAGVTPASAMPLPPPPGPDPATPATAAHGGGLAIWQLALIAAACALALAICVMAARFTASRLRHRVAAPL